MTDTEAQHTFLQKVKIRLIELDKPQGWLCDEITKRTGLFCDNSYLVKICRGKAKAPKIQEAIEEILGVEA